jgi:hypothetical protein
MPSGIKKASRLRLLGRLSPTCHRASFIFPCQAVTERRRQKGFATGRACTAIAFVSERLAAARVTVRSRWHVGRYQGISVSRMRNNPIIVQKYGGTCLETPAKLRAVASSLADLHRRGHRVVAIVSAMGKTTDELVKMAYQVSPHPNRRELDMLLTTGERISMSLMSMALSDFGVPAISFTGSQAGVMTDESHSSARI